jgi:uncharacterized SAM-dependent methyltransferase
MLIDWRLLLPQIPSIFIASGATIASSHPSTEGAAKEMGPWLALCRSTSYEVPVPRTLVFHESQYPESVVAGLVASLRRGQVPGRFLYDSPGQSARWLSYHQAWSPSRTLAQLNTLYGQAFATTWAQRPSGPLTYVGVGCGGGQKDGRFLAAAPAGRPVRYVAADTSPALVMAAAQLADEVCTEQALKVVDLQSQPPRDTYVGQTQDTVVWSCFGMLPNLDAEWLLPYCRGLMADDDLLLISANLSPSLHAVSRTLICPQYDNPEARAWYQGALDELNLAPADYRLEITDRALNLEGSIWRIECHAVLCRDVEVQIFADTIALAQGQKLEVFHSDRYVPEVVPGLLEVQDLQVLSTWVTEDRQEGIYLCATPGSSLR